MYAQRDPDDSAGRVVQDIWRCKNDAKSLAEAAARSSMTSRCVEIRTPGSKDVKVSPRHRDVALER